MKKTIYSIIIAGLALASAACQKVDEKNPVSSSDALTVTASIVNFDGTRVSYAFDDPADTKSAIKPSWENGDEIFGFDEDGDPFTFSVSSVDETGKATFDASGATGLNGTLYAVYYPDKSASDFSGKTLDVDLSSQSGSLDGDTPVIMCATGTISGNTVNFKFVNQTAIVGIYKMQVYSSGTVAAGKSVTGVTLKGAKTAGTIEVVNGALALVPGTGDPADLTASVTFTTDDDGCVDVDPDAIAPYFAVIPQDEVSLTIEASCDGSTCATNAAITGKLAAGKYYYLGKKIYGGTVATIGTTEYATISEAFAAVEDGETIQLQADCSFDSQITLAGKTGEITLDLNGCTLTNGPTLNNKQSRIYLNTEATLIIRDSQNSGGTITSDRVDKDIIKVVKGNLTVASGTIKAPDATDGGNAAIWVEPATSGATTDASVTITGGSIQGPATVSTEDNRAYAIYVDNPGAAITVEGGTFYAQSNSMRIMDAYSVEITGGTFICETSGQITLRFASSAAAGEGYTCTISDEASVSSSSNAVYTYGEGVILNISGGKYLTSSKDAAIISNSGSKSTLSVTGGLFSKAPGFVAEGYVCVNNTDPETNENYPKQVKEFSAVATLSGEGIETMEFASVEGAVDAANAADQACTITLTAPSIVGAQAIVKNTAGVTLDLNDQTLTFGGTDRIYLYENAVLTIVDNGTNGTGTITQNATGSNTLSMTNANSSLTINGGKITCAEGQTTATVYITNGELSMTGGEIIGEKSGISMSGSANVTVSGDAKVTATTTNAILVPAGILTIESGFFAGKGTGTDGVAAVYRKDGATSTVEISGGYYSKAPVNGLLKTGYSCVENTESETSSAYPVKVEISPIVATLTVGGTTTEFTSVEAAVTEANKSSSSCVITILDDITVTTATNVTNGEGVTIDLNDHTLTFSGTNRIRPGAGGKLIIEDSGTDGTITNTTGTNLFYYTGGELVLKSGTLKPYDTSTGVVYVENATFNMEGGTITDDGKNTRALTIGGSDTATVNITGGSISGGNGANVPASGVSVQAGAIFVNNSNAICTIDGADVTVKAPNVTSDYSIRPVVTVLNGELVLRNGTIGDAASNDSGGTGNYTAVYVAGGKYTMEGGYLYARRHAIIFSGSGIATISGGRLATTMSGWSLLRFQDGSTNELTISGGGFTATGSSGKMFAGKTTGAAVPSTATVSIEGGYFDKSPYINGITASNVTGTLSQGSYTYDGKSYSYKVE